MKSCRAIIGAIVVGVISAPVWGLLLDDSSMASAAPAPGAPSVVGNVGCGGAGCHGAPVRGAIPTSHWTADNDVSRWRTSFTVFTSYDPHTRSFEVLGNSLSAQIVEKLPRLGEDKPNAQADVRCLSCHVNPSLAARTDREAKQWHSEGVHCEACHGPGSKYLHVHVGRPADIRSFGLVPLHDLSVRVETCAGCHVGSPARDGFPVRDVTHELIAAGHPRLNFDYATYLRALPPHWTEKDHGSSKPLPISDLSRHWSVGRAGVAAASTELLIDRVGRPKSWPELAEMDCYACHHKLAPSGWPSAPKERPGQLRWNEPVFAERMVKASGDDQLANGQIRLKARMAKPGESKPIAESGREVASGWSRVARKWSEQPVDAESMLAGFEPIRWDDACHAFYARRALDVASGKANTPRLDELRALIRFPKDASGSTHSPSPEAVPRARTILNELFPIKK